MKAAYYCFNRVSVFFFLLSTLLSVHSFAQDTVIKTAQGYIRGIKEEQAVVFKGVPYAQPPIGVLRFKAPLPAKAWADTLSCKKFSSAAAQYGDTAKVLKGSEDCLALNIYTPVTGVKAKLPVVVWVHGGSLTAGTGMGMNGHAFADRDSIVTVTINYRLGVFGFMYLGDVDRALHTSGNNGLLDLIMALKWIRENIKAFGGDPARVTVMGESAGAKLSSTLLLSPKAKGLFSQLVLESGAVQCVRDSVTAKAIRQRLLDELHLTRASELLNLPTDQLIAAQAKVCNGAAGTNYFGPVDDGMVISGDPYAYIAKKRNKKVRLLIGTNKQESRLFMNMDKRLYHPNSIVLKAWFGNNYKYVLSNYQSVTQQIGADSAAFSVLTEYMYKMHTYRLAETLAKAGNQLWMYRFDYSKDGNGATHADELRYVWYIPANHQAEGFNTQLALQVHNAWVNFIKGHRPGKINYADWPPYPGVVKTVMIFNNSSGPTVLHQIFNDDAHPSACFVLN